MDSPFANLTDEQLLALIREAEGGKPQEQPQKLSVRLNDGTVLEAATQDELNKLVQDKLEAAIRAQRSPVEQPRPQAQPQAQPPAWDMKTFVEKFTEDPDGGLEYLEVAKYGMPVRKAVPQMLAIMAALGQKVNELETASFAPKEAAEREAVTQIIRERGWQPSRQAYEDALVLAKATGRIRAQEQPQPQQPEVPRDERGRFIPPRIPRTTGDQGEQTPEDLIRAAQSMPLDKLHDLLVQAGHFNTSR